ncbi:hypothetical protein MHBO_003335 [Bonamia ostreae]|uniref:Glycine--tRNA ligase n=1 Tax=Bonamia ostreae TaxID=126728 RepID=A0ABV2AQ65_9EUKA
MAYPKNVGKAVERLTAKHFLYLPSASIYGGVSGLYDYGPLGCKLKTNIINYWRNFFVLEENIFEIETMTLTPEIVLKFCKFFCNFLQFFLNKDFWAC